MISRLFPPEVVTVVASEAAWSGVPYPEEAACISRAISRRRREFTAGRLCARDALARLGIESFPLLRNDDRTPRWPPGVAGSISHCEGFCGVAVARTADVPGLGLDAESAEPLETELRPVVCTAHEIARAGPLRGPGVPDWGKLIFSAKESFFKCYYPLTKTRLEFHDVEVELHPGARRFTARIVRRGLPPAGGARELHGRFACDGARVYTGVTLSSTGP